MLTGLWDAKVDRAPVLALTGQVNTQVLGPGAFQEIDLASAFQAVSRFSQTVLPGSRHAELMTLALKHAVVERDVVHLIFPDEVQVIPVQDSELIEISKEQRAGNWKAWQTSLHNPGFADFANSCGGLGIRVDEPGQLEAPLLKAISVKECTSLLVFSPVFCVVPVVT